jgi:imidazolonepropionase-like amidohydrolase
VIAIALGTVGCTSAALAPATPEKPAAVEPVPDAPWRHGSEAAGHEPIVTAPAVLIRNAKLLVGDGSVVAKGHVLMRDGRIASVGEGPGEAGEGVEVIDAKGLVVTPGLIDTHSHMGVYASPRLGAHLDGNEMTMPVTPGVRAVDAVWVQDPDLQRAIAGGVTTAQILPGSGNLIGGRAVTIKIGRATAARELHFPGAPDGLKMACGENPKRVYGSRKQTPSTRMGNLAVQRDAFLQARRLIDEWDTWRRQEQQRREQASDDDANYRTKRSARDAQKDACQRGSVSRSTCEGWQQEWQQAPLDEPKPSIPSLAPKRDLHMETLAAAIEGHVLVHVHCYRSDDMTNMLALADEAGFAIRSFHHALEAYKIRGELARRKIGVSTWADWWGFKLEAYDGIQENLALFSQAGGPAIVHSDSAEGIRRLNQEAAKGMWAGRHAGIPISDGEAIKWVTLNPAWALGIEEHVGSLTVGKVADVVLWNRDPFSVYARADRVWIDGALRHDRNAPGQSWSDFEAKP